MAKVSQVERDVANHANQLVGKKNFNKEKGKSKGYKNIILNEDIQKYFTRTGFGEKSS